jgi:hypothetical protein
VPDPGPSMMKKYDSDRRSAAIACLSRGLGTWTTVQPSFRTILMYPQRKSMSAAIRRRSIRANSAAYSGLHASQASSSRAAIQKSSRTAGKSASMVWFQLPGSSDHFIGAVELRRLHVHHGIGLRAAGRGDGACEPSKQALAHGC